MQAKTSRIGAAVAAIGILAGAAGRAQAGTVVVGFDDLPAGTTVADGYGGINWKGEWVTLIQAGYPPHSPPNVVYDVAHHVNTDFAFITPEVFTGAWFSGNQDAPITFNLYLSGSLVATSTTGTATASPSFLASGYGGLVDDVVVTSPVPGHYVMDDVTYQTPGPAVPEPSSVAMSVIAASALGLGASWRRRRESARA